MARKSKGYRSKTRKVLRKRPRERGKRGLSWLLRKYEPGSKVCIKIDPSVHKGMPHRRYHGKIGAVKGERGRSYIVEVKVGGKEKTIIARPEHLEPWRVGHA
jgi:large subunit ribosomal protein L21e